MKNFTLLITFFFAFFITTITKAQVSTVKLDRACINCPTNTPDTSAALEIQATDKGVILPRVAGTKAILKSATSLYSLVLDEKFFETKQMMLSR